MDRSSVPFFNVRTIGTTRKSIEKGKKRKKKDVSSPSIRQSRGPRDISPSMTQFFEWNVLKGEGGWVECVWGTCMNPFPRTVFLSFPIVATRHKPPSAPSWDPLCAHPISLIIPIMLWADIPIKGEEPQQATKR